MPIIPSDIDEREYIPHNMLNTYVDIEINQQNNNIKLWLLIRDLANRYGGNIKGSHLRKQIAKHPRKMEFVFISKPDESKRFADIIVKQLGKIVTSANVYTFSGHLLHQGGTAGEVGGEDLYESKELSLYNIIKEISTSADIAGYNAPMQIDNFKKARFYQLFKYHNKINKLLFGGTPREYVEKCVGPLDGREYIKSVTSASSKKKRKKRN